MPKKEDIIIMRVGKEYKAFLQKKAKEKGVSLSKLIDERLYDTFKSDKEQILDLINKKKQERPVYWKTLEESPIVREFENYIACIYTDFVNPISKNTTYQPVVLLGSMLQILNVTIKNFDSIPEEWRRTAAGSFIELLGKTLVEGLTYIKSNDKETQEDIINMKKDLAERTIYHFTALAFAKDSYNIIKAELEKVRSELIKELKEK
ncbi:MAG: hypothetical protein HYV59_02710 [Planctomycetes bacterium]|nr:hypothetical protein [Planctomycetota bacterium]